MLFFDLLSFVWNVVYDIAWHVAGHPAWPAVNRLRLPAVSEWLALPLAPGFPDPDPAVPAGEPEPQVPPGLQQKTDLLLGWLKWGGTLAGTAGIMISGIMMAVGRRNRSSMAADGASGVPWVLGGCSLVAIAAGVVGAVLQ